MFGILEQYRLKHTTGGLDTRVCKVKGDMISEVLRTKPTRLTECQLVEVRDRASEK